MRSLIQGNCTCGRQITGNDEDEVVAKFEEHFAADHRELWGKYSKDELLRMVQETNRGAT